MFKDLTPKEQEGTIARIARTLETTGFNIKEIPPEAMQEITRSAVDDKCYETLNLPEDGENKDIRTWLVETRKMTLATQEHQKKLYAFWDQQRAAGRQNGEE